MKLFELLAQTLMHIFTYFSLIHRENIVCETILSVASLENVITLEYRCCVAFG